MLRIIGDHRSAEFRLQAERTARRSDVSEADFVQFYPYLPHYIELSIDIMSGIRHSREHLNTWAAAIEP